MKSKLKFLIPLFGLSFLAGCVRTPFCETGYGKITTEERNLNDFNKIDLNIDGNVYVSQGDTQSVVISAQQNIIDIVETNVSNNELKIKFDECLNYYDGIEIFITVKELKSLQISGSGSFISEEPIDVESLELIIDGSGEIKFEDLWVENVLTSKINGSGDISLGGPESTQTHNIDINGSGNIYAFEFPTDNVNLSVNGSGNTYVNAIKTLDVQIFGSGSVYYMGFPDIKINITGSGNIYESN